jgi:hypothetical protein
MKANRVFFLCKPTDCANFLVCGGRDGCVGSVLVEADRFGETFLCKGFKPKEKVVE